MKLSSLNKIVFLVGISISLCLASTLVYSATLFMDDFESGSKAPNRNGYGWGGSSNGPDEAPITVSTDIAHSGKHSLKFTFGGGSDTDDAWSEQRYHLGENRNEVYIQWYQYFPDGTEGLGPKWKHRNSSAADNNKFLKLWAEKYAGYTITTGVSTWADGHTGSSKPFPVFGTNLTRGVGRFGEPFAKRNIDDEFKGKWVKFQFRLATASSSNNDGVIQMWMNNELIINSKSIPLYPKGGKDNFFRNGYIMGWANSGFDETSHTYIDDFQISDTYID